MNDQEIRDIIHKQILTQAHSCPNTLVVNELGIKNGFARADIAVLNGTLAAYEIKGLDDSFFRLNRQIEAYNSVFVYSSLVTSCNHLAKAYDFLPQNWGIYVTHENANGWYLKKMRTPRENKNTDPFSIAQLLWKDEALEIIESTLKVAIPKRSNRKELYEILATSVSKTKLLKLTIEKLKARQHWRTGLVQPV